MLKLNTIAFSLLAACFSGNLASASVAHSQVAFSTPTGISDTETIAVSGGGWYMSGYHSFSLVNHTNEVIDLSKTPINIFFSGMQAKNFDVNIYSFYNNGRWIASQKVTGKNQFSFSGSNTQLKPGGKLTFTVNVSESGSGNLQPVKVSTTATTENVAPQQGSINVHFQAQKSGVKAPSKVTISLNGANLQQPIVKSTTDLANNLSFNHLDFGQYTLTVTDLPSNYQMHFAKSSIDLDTKSPVMDTATYAYSAKYKTLRVKLGAQPFKASSHYQFSNSMPVTVGSTQHVLKWNKSKKFSGLKQGVTYTLSAPSLTNGISVEEALHKVKVVHNMTATLNYHSVSQNHKEINFQVSGLVRVKKASIRLKTTQYHGLTFVLHNIHNGDNYINVPTGQYDVAIQSAGGQIAHPQSFNTSETSVEKIDFNVAPPFIMGYYANYSGYFNNNHATGNIVQVGHAIPEPSYPIPGIKHGYPKNNQTGQAQPTTNPDLAAKVNGLSALAYGFLMPLPDGQFIFSDSWADLAQADVGGALCPLQDGATSAPCIYYSGLNGVRPIVQSALIKLTDNNKYNYASYGGFDAFLKLQNKQKDLKHYIVVGGWTYRDIMNDLVSSDGKTISSKNIDNFVDTLAKLSKAGVQGVDLDVEFSDSSTGYKNSLLMQALAENTDNVMGRIKALNLALSITTQANPIMLSNLVEKGWIQDWIKNGVAHINLMTYDFHGAFDYNKSEKKGITGFNSSLFAAPNHVSDPFAKTNADFSVAKSVAALQKLTPVQMAHVTIGLPAYARAAITNVKSGANNGLFSTYAADSSLMRGDLDTANCAISLEASTLYNPKDPELTQCSGTFGYNYILANMLKEGFVAKDWQYTDPKTHKTYYIGSTAYAPSWTASQSKVVFANNNTALAPASAQSGNNVYMAYLSAKDARSYGEYARTEGLGGAIIWTVMNDAPYTDTKDSLTYNFALGFEQQS